MCPRGLGSQFATRLIVVSFLCPEEQSAPCVRIASSGSYWSFVTDVAGIRGRGVAAAACEANDSLVFGLLAQQYARRAVAERGGSTDEAPPYVST